MRLEIARQYRIQVEEEADIDQPRNNNRVAASPQWQWALYRLAGHDGQIMPAKAGTWNVPRPMSRFPNRDNDRLSRQQRVRNYRNPARRLFLERVQPNTSAGNGAFTSEDPCTSSRATSRVPATTRCRPAFDNVCRHSFYFSTVEEFNARFSRRCPAEGQKLATYVLL